MPASLVRFAMYRTLAPTAFAVVVGVTLAGFVLSVFAYDPGRGMLARRGGPAPEPLTAASPGVPNRTAAK